MTEPTALPPAAERFLEQLRHESATLPASEQQQLLGQIREHLGEAIDDGSDAESVLERLGSPRELVIAAGGDEAAPAAPWRASPLLWFGLAALVAGLFLLLWGGGLFALTGMGRSLLLALPGLLLAIAGAVALVRELRSRGDDPAEALAKRRFVRGLAIACIALGALGLLLAGTGFALTGRGRSVLLALPGLLLAIGGGIALVRARSGSARV